MSPRLKIFLISLTIFFGSFDSLQAQSIEQKLKECVEIEVSLIRLQCFDRIANTPQVENSKSSNERRGIFSRMTSNDDQAEVTESDENTAETESSENKINKNDSDDNFGLVIRDERDEISSKILGLFEGWTGTTKFTLENGQVWQQASFGVLRVKMNNPNIIIKRSILSDTYTLKIEGLNSSIRVKRIK
tara:strand:- start:2640 stop:3206 length:567 start_codon:yes stop_codon:yes gene_type:complete